MSVVKNKKTKIIDNAMGGLYSEPLLKRPLIECWPTFCTTGIKQLALVQILLDATVVILTTYQKRLLYFLH